MNFKEEIMKEIVLLLVLLFSQSLLNYGNNVYEDQRDFGYGGRG